MSPMSLADCRASARAIRAAEHGREAIRVARPRSVLGIVRSRGPLSVMLRVADAEGRVVRSGPDSLALLERPQFVRLPEAPRGLRLLRLIDRRWDLLVFAVPPAVALAVAAAAAVLSVVRDVRPPLVILVLALFAMAYIAVFMLAQMVFASDAVRLRSKDELAAESLPGFNWSLPLCHHAGPGDGSQLLRLASARMEQLVKRSVAADAEARGVEIEESRVREVLVCLTRGVTTDAMRRVVTARLKQPYGPDSRVALRKPHGPVSAYRKPVKAGGGFFFVYIGGVAVVVAVLAVFVATVERQACGGVACAERPSTYLTALQWLTWRLVWQSAPGITAATLQTQVFGWLLSIAGMMAIPVGWVSARLAINQHKEMLADHEALSDDLSNTRVLLMTVTRAEREAVLRTIPPITGQEPERSYAGESVIYELGAAGRTTLGLVQCAGQGPRAAQSTATRAIRKWKPHVVVMVGICYGLRNDDWKPPQQLTDVIVATTIHDLDPRIEHENRIELFGDRTTARAAIVERLEAASSDWHTARVWFGLMLSAQTLIDSKTRRDALRQEHSRALGGEMEAHGLLAAAADSGTPWIVVKAISDWGVDRDVHYRPDDAAANAAGFVAHAVVSGAFDEWPWAQA